MCQARVIAKYLTTHTAWVPTNEESEMLPINPDVAGLTPLLQISLVPGTVLRNLLCIILLNPQNTN